MKIKRIICLVFLLVFSLTSIAAAAEPIDILKNSFSEGISIIDSESGKSDKLLQRERLWTIMHKLFDFTQISMLALGNNWKQFNNNQKKDFVDVFTTFLGDTYIDKVQEAYKGEQIEYVKQNIVNEKKVVVETTVVSKEKKIPISYSMFKKENTWKVYDVKVEGVSLIQNYRNQFGRILLSGTPDKLIEQIKEKLIK